MWLGFWNWGSEKQVSSCAPTGIHYPPWPENLGKALFLGKLHGSENIIFLSRGQGGKQLARGHCFCVCVCFFFTNLSFYLIYHLFSHFLLTYIFFSYSFSPSFLLFLLGFTKRLHAQTNT